MDMPILEILSHMIFESGIHVEFGKCGMGLASRCNSCKKPGRQTANKQSSLWSSWLTSCFSLVLRRRTWQSVSGPLSSRKFYVTLASSKKQPQHEDSRRPLHQLLPFRKDEVVVLRFYSSFVSSGKGVHHGVFRSQHGA